MEILSEKIMQYIERTGSLEDAEKSIIKFGIQSSLEIGTNILVSMLVLYRLNVIPEGIFFFCIFIPVRMYSGGYHADTYFRCLIFSLLSLFGVMQMSSRLHIAVLPLFILISLQEVMIWKIAPVISAERPVSHREYQIFSDKLWRVLIVIELIAGILALFGIRRFMNVLLLSLLLIVITLLIGKIKYRDYQMK